MLYMKDCGVKTAIVSCEHAFSCSRLLVELFLLLEGHNYYIPFHYLKLFHFQSNSNFTQCALFNCKRVVIYLTVEKLVSTAKTVLRLPKESIKNITFQNYADLEDGIFTVI